MPHPNGPRTRILRLYRTFTTLDAGLVAAALGITQQQASGQLITLFHAGQVLRASRRSARRPYLRIEYHREVR
ncbi:hypothetical protein [Deinococcus budaensis]